jgi:hypothetical protein
MCKSRKFYTLNLFDMLHLLVIHYPVFLLLWMARHSEMCLATIVGYVSINYAIMFTGLRDKIYWRITLNYEHY